VDVELHNLVAGHRALVLHIDGDLHCPRRPDLLPVKLEARESEGRVAEPVAEWIQRRRGEIRIARRECWIVFGSVRKIVVVVDGNLAGDAQPGDRKPGAGIHVAKEHIGDGVAAFRAGYQASRMAGTCSAAHEMSSGRP